MALVSSKGLYVGYDRRGSSQAEIFRDRGQATADQAWQVTSFIYFYVFIYLAALRLSRSMWELHCVMWASCGLLFNCGMRAPELVGPSTGKDLPCRKVLTAGPPRKSPFHPLK